MNGLVDIFKLFTDRLRVRIIMLLAKKELSVCQLMGITGASQPLVSRNLSLLFRGGFLHERREGKLRFYRISRGLSGHRRAVLDLLTTCLKSDAAYRNDLATLKECSKFQKKVGRCDMKTLKEFMNLKKRRSTHDHSV